MNSALTDLSVSKSRSKEMSWKERMGGNFSRAAANYDSSSREQVRYGKKLITKLQNSFLSSPLQSIARPSQALSEPSQSTPRRGLDLGSATGQLTAFLKNTLKLEEVHGIDLSQAMVDYAQANYGQGGLSFFNGDLSHPQTLPQSVLSSQYDIIFSNAVLHWLFAAAQHTAAPPVASKHYDAKKKNDSQYLRDFLLFCWERLAPGGCLGVSIYLDETYQELETAWPPARLQRIRFPRASTVMSTLASFVAEREDFCIVNQEIMRDQLAFQNVSEFHNYQRRLGTQNPNVEQAFDERQSPSTLRKLLRESPYQQPFSLTVKVLLFVVKKITPKR